MNSKYLYVLSFVFLLLAAPSLAFAQDTSSDVVDLSEESTVVTEEGDTATNDLPTVDPDDPLYWSQMRDVYVYQKKGVQKDGRFAISLYAGIIPNNMFEQYAAFGLRLNYYLLENLSLELASSYDVKVSTSLKDFLTARGGIHARGVILGDSQLSHTTFGVTWSPLYGKTTFYQATINYFDLYLFAGLGLAIVQTEANFGKDSKADYKPEGALGAGVTFFITDNALLRIDYRQFIFAKVSGGLANPSEISLAFGWMF